MVVFCTNNAKQALGSVKGVMPGTNCSFLPRFKESLPPAVYVTRFEGVRF